MEEDKVGVVQVVIGLVLLVLGVVFTLNSSYIMFGLVLVGGAMVIRGLNEKFCWWI